MKIAGLALLAVALLVLAALMLLPGVIERSRQDLAEAAGRALGEPVTVGALDLTLIPLRIEIGAVQIGEPARITLEELVAGVRASDSLRSGRLQVDLDVSGLQLDLSGSSSGEDDGAAELQAPIVPFPVRVDLAAERLGIVLDQGHQIELARLNAGLDVTPLRGVALEAEGDGIALRAERDVVVDRISAAAQLVGRRLTIESLQLSGRELSIEAAADEAKTKSQAAGFAPVAITASGSLGPTLEFFVGETGVEGEASLDIDIAGRFSDPEISGVARVEPGSFQGFELSSVSAEVHRADGLWQLRQVAIARPEGRLNGDVQIDEGKGTLSGQVRWDEVALPLTGSGARQWHMRSAGSGDLAIDFEPFVLRFDGDGWLGAGPERHVPFSAEVQTDGTSSSGNVEVGSDGANHGSVRVTRADPEALAGDARLRIESIETVLEQLGYPGKPALRGGLGAEIALSGNVDQPVAAVTVASSDLRLYDGRPAVVRASAEVSTSAVAVRQATVEAGDGAITGEGRIAVAEEATNDFAFRVTDFDLTALLETFAGQLPPAVAAIAGIVGGNGRVDGPWSAPKAAIDLDVSDAAWRERKLGVVSLAARVEDRQWSAVLDAAHPESGVAQIEVGGTDRGVGQASATVLGWPLETLVGSAASELAGKVGVRAEIATAPTGLDGNIEITLTELTASDSPLGDSNLEAVGSKGLWQVSGGLLGGNVDLQGRLETAGDGPFELQVEWAKTELPVALEQIEDLTLTSRGSLRASGKVADAAATTVSLRVDEVVFASGADRLSGEEALEMEWKQGQLALSPFVLSGNGTRLALSGNWSPSRPSTARVEGRVSLGWVARVIDPIEDSSGSAVVEVEARLAPDREPVLSGTVALDDAGFRIGDLSTATKVRGEIELRPGLVRTDSITGEFGGGFFSVSGLVDFARGPRLDWKFREISLEPVERLDMVLTGEGTLTGAWDEALLSGDITIVELLYDRNLELQDLIPFFGKAMRPVPARRNARPPLRLALQVHARDGLHVENNIATIEARTDLDVRGTVRAPQPRGKIEVLDGTVSIRSRKFEVVNGVLKFQPEIPGEAYIDFLAESVIDSSGTPYLIQVRVSGTTDNYRVTLDSDEGLSQTDIASLIAFGKTVSELQEGSSAGATGASRFEQVAAIAGGQVGNLLADELEGTLPFDEIELRAGFSTATGEFEPQLRLGKTINEDLSAWIAQTFGVQPQTGLEISYALSRQVVAVLRWESQTQSQEGAIGGEVSQRLDFWGLPSWLSWGDDD